MAGIFQTFANFPNGAGYFQMAQIVFQMAQILRHLRPYGRLCQERKGNEEDQLSTADRTKRF